MIHNYFTIALRYILRAPIFSIINLCGLVIGITASTFLTMYVWDELRYDRFHTNADNIYRVTTHQDSGQEGVVTPGPLGPELLKDQSAILDMARVGKWSGTFRYKDVIFEENQINFADNSFLKMFSFPLIIGDQKTALKNPYDLLLTKTAAIKYFGTEWRNRHDILGATFMLNGNEAFTVVGILEDLPSYSSIQFDFLLSFEHIVKNDKWGYQWGSHNYHTYLLLKPEVDLKVFETAIRGQLKTHNENAGFDLMLQPLTQIYMSPITGYDWGKHGQIQYVIIFSIVGGIILVVACFNYINLSTARARKRAREVGIRKVIGAHKHQLFIQFMGESILIVFVSGLIARALVDVLLPYFNLLSGKNLISSEFQFQLLALIFAIVTVTSFLSGIYPAILLSSFKPLNVLRGTISNRVGGSFRSMLVTTQFSISMILIVGTLVMYDQLFFMKTKDVGFNKDELVYVKLGGALVNNNNAFKNELISKSFVKSAARSTSTLVNTDNGSYIDWPGKSPGTEITISQINVDEDFLPMLNVKFLSGRNFMSTDSSSYILNEEAVKAMGLTVEKAIGMKVKFWGTEGTIISVVKNFHFRPLHHAIGPLIIRHALEENFYTMVCRVEKRNMARFADEVAKLFKQHEKEYPFQYAFVDEMINSQYQKEVSAGKIILYFSILSIFISTIGLFGLVAYTIEVRTKELSIRKVLGSSYVDTFILLSKHFLAMLVIAFIIAIPSAWWVSNNWLQNFNYRIDIGTSVFLKTLFLIGAGSLLMVFIQSLRASGKSPANVLKALD